ncbi:MAG TPA: hypothetical protein VF669_07165 [Tepidisphaeraceae bacterium]|jgi:hypothetical protein
MGRVRDFFADSTWIDATVLRPLSHIRFGWEIQWDAKNQQYVPEEGTFGDLLNELIEELDSSTPPIRYHDHEDVLGRRVQRDLKWEVEKRGSRWVHRDGSPVGTSDYLALLEQGAFADVGERNLLLAAAGRIKAAMDRGQMHFDDMDERHMWMLAGVLSAILYHRAFNEQAC